MGMFLSLTGVIGKNQNEVTGSLAKYAKSVGGGLREETLSTDDNNCCVIKEANGNTTIFYPYGYLEWDKSSEFISRDLNAPVFSFHIHDGDLWMYVLFVNGETVDQFNPIPDYWEENLSEEEIQNWKGNATIIAKHIKSVRQADIERYLVRWDLEAEDGRKAYTDDEFVTEDWQLLDFMKKLGLSYPVSDEGNPQGQTHELWTKELRLKPQASKSRRSLANNNSSKPWWKIW